MRLSANYFFILFFFQLSFITTNLAQSTRDMINLEVRAKEHFEKNNFYEALQDYLLLDRYSDEKNQYSFNIGVSYLNLYQHKNALPYLERCNKQKSDYGNSLNYYLAKCYQLEYRFDESIIFYKKYIEGIQEPRKYKSTIEEIEHEIATCHNAQIYVENPINVKIKNLSPDINSIFPEYGALFSADEQTIIFTSDRPNTTGGHIYQLDGTYYEDIYIAHKTDSGWTDPLFISNKINTWHHDATVALSHDGHKLILYRYATDHLLHQSGDLYMSEFINGEWTKPKHLNSAINSKGWEPSACFSLDDKEIYFTSNRKGGYGGTDIYSIRQNDDGSWGEPKNIENTINTRYNEDSPYFHPDGKTFYFSSQGHNSMGGYDIFKSTYDPITKQWSAPKNLGHPINTPDDDIDFSVSADGRKIYFSDNRLDGYGDKDIYYAELPIEETDLLCFKGSVLDEEDYKNGINTPMDVLITIKSVNTDNPITRIASSNLNANGKFVVVLNEGVKYEVSFEAKGYKTFTEELDTRNQKGYHEKTEFILLKKK